MLAQLFAIALQAAAPDAARQVEPVEAAARLMAAGHPAEAIATLDPALAAFDRQYAAEHRRIYCSFSPADTLASLLGAAVDHTNAVSIGP